MQGKIQKFEGTAVSLRIHKSMSDIFDIIGEVGPAGLAPLFAYGRRTFQLRLQNWGFKFCFCMN
jgi:hypothetical protein